MRLGGDAATLPRQPEGRVVIARTQFNQAIVDRLVAGAKALLSEAGVLEQQILELSVPGALELPMAFQYLNLDGISCGVALGAVIQGETYHFELVSQCSSDGLMKVTLDRGLPIGNGVLTCYTVEQAEVRSAPGKENKGYEAALAALHMAELKKLLAEG